MLHSAGFVFILMWTSVLGQSCVSYNFESDYDYLFHINDICSDLPLWRLNNYTSMDIPGAPNGSQHFIEPVSDISCGSSFSFHMEDGILEINVYMKSNSANDVMTVIVTEIVDGGNDKAHASVQRSPAFPPFSDGWNVVRVDLRLAKSITGYVTFFGAKSEDSIMLIDSFRYYPRSREEECRLYETVESTTEITTNSGLDTTTQSPSVTYTTTHPTFDTTINATPEIGTTNPPLDFGTTTNIMPDIGITNPTPEVETTSNSVPEFDTTTNPGPELEITTTSAPDSTTSPPDSTTSPPDSTTSAPDSTTSAPDITTSAPDSTTSAPDITTSAPDSTTSAPDSTTSVSDSTTSAPEITPSVPDITTSAPDSTTSALDKTTSALDSTTTEQDSVNPTTVPPVELEECITYNFDHNFDALFTDEHDLCGDFDTWSLKNYSSIEIDTVNAKGSLYLSPKDDLSCISAFPMRMSPNGVVEVNVYIEPASELDYIIVLVKQLVSGSTDTVAGFYIYEPSVSSFVKGWNVLRISVMNLSNFDGYLLLLGSASEGSTVIVDSFRYIPPWASEDDESCKI